ncbi:MAG: TetR/AcrR family transcriptional regulator [Eubacteriaceae bacterium]
MAYKKSIQTKKSIIESCKQIIFNKNWNDITVRDIATVAKINNPLIYYYFNNKDEIAYTIYADMLSSVVDLSEEIIPFKDDMLLNHFIHVILAYKCVSTSKIYNKLFMETLNTFDLSITTKFNSFSQIIENQFYSIFKKYNINLEKKYAKIYGITAYAVANSMFRSVLNNEVDFTFEESIIFITRYWVINIGIDKSIYNDKINKALEICQNIDLSKFS